MIGNRTPIVVTLTALIIGLSASPAAADPDHPRCATRTIQTRADVPSEMSMRAIQEGLIYPPWCR